jgi:hypothetical protein
MSEDKPETELHSATVYLQRIAADIKIIRQQSTELLRAVRDAESEVPEKMRRFANYWHDVVHIKEAYVSLGIQAPRHVDHEMERCSDRFRQVLEELHGEDGAFEQVRRKMADDINNVYDHTKQLAKPKEKT